MQNLSSNLPVLKNLRLHHPLGEGLADLGALTSLTHLHVSNLPFFDYQLSNLVNLEELSIIFSKLSVTTANEICDLRNLKRLELVQVTSDWDHVESYGRLNLESAKLDTNMTPNQFNRIAGSLPCLKQ